MPRWKHGNLANMCYSALVAQRIKDLGLRYEARIQIDAFDELFKARLEGSGAKVPRAMETNFLTNPKSAVEVRIEKNIREFQKITLMDTEKNLFNQTKRLADAERSLLTKVTKKAQNDQRVATEKIEKAKEMIALLKTGETVEDESRIYPGQYAPLVIVQNGERVIAPFRYLLRPKGQPESFDRKYNGAYNARYDTLDKKFFWQGLVGYKHAVMEVFSFWENVKVHRYEKRDLREGEEEKNLVLHFTPESHDPLNVPCIFDTNTEGDFPLHSFALITDDPNPEVAAAGHDRTPVFMRDKYVELWLQTQRQSLSHFKPVFADKQPTYFEHAVAA